MTTDAFWWRILLDLELGRPYCLGMAEELVSIKVRHQTRTWLKTQAAKSGKPIYQVLDDLMETAKKLKRGE